MTRRPVRRLKATDGDVIPRISRSKIQAKEERRMTSFAVARSGGLLLAAVIAFAPIAGAFSLPKPLVQIGGFGAHRDPASTCIGLRGARGAPREACAALGLGKRREAVVVVRATMGSGKVLEETKYTKRFRGMLQRVAAYTDVEIAGTPPITHKDLHGLI